MTSRIGLVPALILVVWLAGCASTPASTEPAASIAPSGTPASSATVQPTLPPTPSPTAPATRAPAEFPIDAFADTSELVIGAAVASELQSILDDLAGGTGTTATVMSPAGTWTGATGSADGTRDVVVDDQFAIASITKPIVAAQVMQMTEAGELGLDDVAADYLPAGLDFDANGATIRQLLGHRSGLPGYDLDLFDPATQESPTDDRQRVWTTAEMLDYVLTDRVPAGGEFSYTNTNYLLLGLVIEQVRGRPIAEVLREGVLGIEGVERLIYQPDELPTEPMAMPFARSIENLEEGGGYLPSLAGVTVDGAAGSMASDSLSLARWWRAFCAGEIVSQASLTEMTSAYAGYGLGLYEPDPPGTVGHGGEHVGYISLAGCQPQHGIVVVVLANDMVDLSRIAGPLVQAVRSP